MVKIADFGLTRSVCDYYRKFSDVSNQGLLRLLTPAWEVQGVGQLDKSLKLTNISNV